MPTLPTDVRLTYAQKTTTGGLYYECKRCGRKTKSYRKIKRHLHSCAKENLHHGSCERTSAPR